ncbi:MAG TPA: YihY/virulence factor BrkB family protein [Bacteroidales bacterium]|nr:YihY/virulence factor BrkB family protein [Bacteroidales bacterium]HPS63541.1 YihY/virulence factor BrkB family protein [Bacteroidales bacterium]
MTLLKRLILFLQGLPATAYVLRVSRKLVLPGFNSLPLYDVAGFFFRGLTKGYITSRAAAISYSVFLAIFPFLIFLFSIIPFIPIENFQIQLLLLVRDFIPASTFETVRETIIDIVTRPRSSLLLVNLLLSLYFSTNGVNKLIVAFNNTYHHVETRPGYIQYLASLLIVLVNSLLLILAIGLITLGPGLLSLLLPRFLEESALLVILIEMARWLIILGLLLTAISFIYYLAPGGKKSFRFFSAGSILSTLLVILTTLGFNFYVDHFSSYNVLYGSLGTLMIVLVWIYINAISLLIGFELNASIQSAGKT